MVRLGFIIGFIALIGVLLSGLAAYRVHEQELAIDGIALSRAIDVHASLVQDRLTERELLARVASGLFRASSVVKANMLQPLRSAIYAFKTDFVIAFWIARLKPADLAAAQAELEGAGFTNPTIRDFDDQPLDIKAIDTPLDVLMDLEPRSADTLGFPGRAYDRHSVIGPMLMQAAASGKPVASNPIPLLRQDGPIGIVLASRILKEGTSEPAGFVTFSYELSPLMLTNDDRSLFSVVLKDPDDASDEYVANDQGAISLRAVKQGDPAPSVVRTVTFGGRDWSLGYYAKNNAVQRAQQTAIIVAAIGLALTGIVCGLFGYVAYNNLRLSREIQVRIGFERRLTAVIDELNHRVKNILAVIQSIVTRTLRHGSDMDVVARSVDRPHPCDVERGDAAQRKPVAGRQAQGAVRVRARSRTPTASRSTVLISPSARAPRSRCRCCSSNWPRIPTRACRWSASTRTSSPSGKSRARSRTWCFISAGKSSTPARRRGGKTAISASSCSTASRPKRSAAPPSATSPTSATSTNSPRRWSPSST